MRNAFIINGHQPDPFAKDELNGAVASRITQWPRQIGFETLLTATAESYDVDAEIEASHWQTPHLQAAKSSDHQEH